MGTVYMSIEKGFLDSPPNAYRSSKRIVPKLNDLVNLHLVHPSDYLFGTSEILKSYKYHAGRLVEYQSRHQPEGDIFIIYGDETSKNHGVDFGREQYAFLRNLRARGLFNRFINDPNTEELMMKDALVNLCKEPALSVASTFCIPIQSEMKQLIEQYGYLILKPKFGCRSTGVKKITSLHDVQNIDFGQLRNNYVLQEPLDGPEVRVVILEGEFLFARHDENLHPWDNPKDAFTKVGEPNNFQITTAKNIATRVKADIIGIDFIGCKVYELNGTGTGLVICNQLGQELVDYTSHFVDWIMGKLDEK